MRDAAEPLVAQLELGDGERLVGDIGLIAVKAMLENGVGYIVTGWTDAANQIDAAIDTCRRSVFARRGVLLRRLRSFDAAALMIQEPGASAIGSDVPMRGLVVWNGRSGTRPAVEQLLQLDVPGPVVVMCFDTDVLHIPDAVVIDPECSPRGFVAAIDAAFGASASVGRPVCVLVRQRVLDMRGTLLCRDNMSVQDAATIDAVGVPRCTTEAAVERCGLNLVLRSNEEHPGATMVCAPAMVAPAVVRAIDHIVHELVQASAHALAARIRDTAVVARAVPSVVTESMRACMQRVDHMLMLESGSTSAQLDTQVVDGMSISPVRVPVDHVRVPDLVRIIATHMRDINVCAADEAADAVLERLAALPAAAHDLTRVTSRLPRRGAGMSSPLPDQVAAALIVAQADMGVPARVSDHHSSYLTNAGGMLTVVSAQQLADMGAGCAAPAAQRGTYLVHGGVSAAAQAACASMGASVEVVDGAHPRQVARAISRAVCMPDIQPHVIFVGAGVPGAIDPTAVVGMDRDLIRAERLSSVTMPAAAYTIAEDRDDPLSPGVSVQPVDPRSLQVGLHAAREMSAGWYAVRASTNARPSGWQRIRWIMRRRVIRSLGGMDI